jgi:serralysin
MSFTKKVAASQDIPEANWLLSGTGWDLSGTGRGLPNGVLTYSFPDSSSDYGKGNTNGFQPFQQAQKVAFHSIFDGLEALTNANFVEVTATGGLLDLDGATSFTATDGSAILRYAKTSKLVADSSYTYLPSEKADGGDSWFGNANGVFNGASMTGLIEVGTYPYAVLLHEVGHSLGLEHSFDKGPYGVVPSAMDSLEYTVMSYSSFSGARDWYNADRDFPQTYMMLDIASLQQMYGADFSTSYSSTKYTWDTNGGMHINGAATAALDAPGTDTIFMTLWDGGGIDTIDASNFSGVHIDLTPGHWITLSHDQLADLDKTVDGLQAAAGNIANSLYVSGTGPDGQPTDNLIENAIGGVGPDWIAGNEASNRIQGGGGADTLAGGPGADFFVYHELAASTGASPDTILDFDGSDGFMFAGIDAQPTSSKVQEFTWHEGLHNYQELQTGEFGFVPNATGGTLFARTDSDSIIDFQVDVTFSGPVTFTASSVHQESVFLV